MPDVAAGITLEPNNNASYRFRIGLDGIFPSAVTGWGRRGYSYVIELSRQEVFIGVEALAIEDLKADKVQVDWVYVRSGVGETPDFN